jgi:(R,R)-butanediol dehydrogenase / meso-butanediol dehydrogenase / diacetyl reductase
MKSVRFHAARDVRVEDVPPPAQDRLKPNQVLVKNRFCGICGTDLHEYIAGPIFIPREPHPYTRASGPQTLGHEFGGEVVAIGTDVNHVKPGDRVSIQPLITPRDDYFGKLGLHQLSDQLGLVGLSWPWGGMSEYSVLNDYNVFRMPDAVTDEQSALIEPGAVAVYAIDRSGLRAGNSALITGAGPIGALTMLAARAAGASRIFISDTNDNRLRLMREILPDCITVNPTKESLVDAIRDQTEGHVGVDVALECVGNNGALTDCINAVRRQGVVVQVGLHVKPATIDGFTVTFKDIELRGSWTYPTQVWPRIASMVESGIFPVEKVVTKRIRLDDVVGQGFEALLDPAATQLKILIDIRN